jgi:hypothetical protein
LNLEEVVEEIKKQMDEEPSPEAIDAFENGEQVFSFTPIAEKNIL